MTVKLDYSYVPVPLEYFNIAIELKPATRYLLLHIIRETLGWQEYTKGGYSYRKSSYNESINEIARRTKLDRSTIIEGLKTLTDLGLISRSGTRVVAQNIRIEPSLVVGISDSAVGISDQPVDINDPSVGINDSNGEISDSGVEISHRVSFDLADQGANPIIAKETSFKENKKEGDDPPTEETEGMKRLRQLGQNYLERKQA
jgi:DNA-binding transcriptional ArsR family regulator